ncbi:protein LONGIFOLIA 2 [Rosa sericea]
MAAKLLHSLADDNPDLQKQIGCMNGIFQIFDRHQVLTGRRISHHKRLPPGNSHYSNGGLERESNNPYHRQAVTVITLHSMISFPFSKLLRTMFLVALSYSLHIVRILFSMWALTVMCVCIC